MKHTLVPIMVGPCERTFNFNSILTSPGLHASGNHLFHELYEQWNLKLDPKQCLYLIGSPLSKESD